MRKKFLLILSMIICLPALVFAKDKPFYKRFETKNFYSMMPYNFEKNYITKEIEMNNYYVIINQYINYDYDEYTISLKKYDNRGNFIKESELEDCFMMEATGDNNYFYILYETSDSTELKKLDSNLSIIKTYTFSYEQDQLLFENYDTYSEINSGLMNLKDDKINIFLGDVILQFSSDFSSSKILSANYNTVKSLFPKIFKAMQFNTDIYDSNESYQAFYDEEICDEAIHDEDAYQCTPSVKLYDNNDNFLWKVIFPGEENDEYIRIFDVKIIDDYIVVLKNYFDEYYNEEYSDFIIYDLKGNEIEKIEATEFYYNIKATSLGFMSNYTKKYQCPQQRKASEDEQVTLFRQQFTKSMIPIDYCTYKIHEEFYYLYYLVDSKITGNGKIEVSNKAKAGEQVSFKAQADSNYTVKNVTVKDMNGNTIKVENGSFTMPEEDVIIEAEFITLSNPYTKGGLIALIGITIISIGSYILIKRQKLTN